MSGILKLYEALNEHKGGGRHWFLLFTSFSSARLLLWKYFKCEAYFVVVTNIVFFFFKIAYISIWNIFFRFPLYFCVSCELYNVSVKIYINEKLFFLRLTRSNWLTFFMNFRHDLFRNIINILWKKTSLIFFQKSQISGKRAIIMILDTQ